MAEGGAGTVSDDTPVAKAKSGSPNILESPEDRKLAYHKLDGVPPGVVYVHGLSSDMEGVKALALEDYCRSQGRAFVRFDLSGHGQSSEKFTECNVTTWLEDLTSVLNSLTNGPQVLIGNSTGAWLMFLYSMRNPEKVHALIGISSAPDFTQQLWKRLAKEDKQELKRTGLYKMPSPYMPDPIQVTMQLIQDGDRYNILDMPGKPCSHRYNYNSRVLHYTCIYGCS